MPTKGQKIDSLLQAIEIVKEYGKGGIKAYPAIILADAYSELNKIKDDIEKTEQ